MTARNASLAGIAMMLLGILLFPLSVTFAAGLLTGLGWRRGYDELVHLNSVARGF